MARDEKNCMEFCLNLPTLDGTYNSTSVSLKQMSNLQAHCNLKVEHDIEIVDLGEAVCYQVFLGVWVTDIPFSNVIRNIIIKNLKTVF